MTVTRFTKFSRKGLCMHQVLENNQTMTNTNRIPIITLDFLSPSQGKKSKNEAERHADKVGIILQGESKDTPEHT